jgi:uncharacterized repeat protein (TIGR01451 family)
MLILPLIILNGEAFSLAMSEAETPGEAVPSDRIRQAVDAADGLGQIHADDGSAGFVTIDPQQLAGFPAYGPVTVLQEDTGSSIIDLLPAYANITDNLENMFGVFFIHKEGDTYLLWLGSRVRTDSFGNVSSVDQRFESQDGLVWRNRTDTNLVNTGPHKFVEGLRGVIKTGNTYEGWEQYYYEWTLGWGVAVRYVTSDDGITWTVVSQPALVGAEFPSIGKVGNTYHMWAHPSAASNYNINRSLRYRTSTDGGSGWGDWQTEGTLVNTDGENEVPRMSRVRQLGNGEYQLFYLNGSKINLATTSDGINFTTQVTDILDVLEVLSIPTLDFIFLRDFAVVDVNGEDWFYFTYCETKYPSGLCQHSRIAVSRPLPQLSISKAGPAVVAAGEPITYTLTISNMGNSPATDLVVTDTLPSGANYLDGSGGTLTGNVVTWQIPVPSGNTTTQVQFAVTATETITNAAYEVTGTGYGTIGEAAVVTLVSEQGAPQQSVYLPVILRDYVTFPLHIGNAIDVRNAAYQGEVFYTKSLRIPANLPAGGHFYFSSQPVATAPVLIDDEIAMLHNGSEVFSHDFAAGGGNPQPAVVEVPRTTLEPLAGQTVRIEYRDVYGFVVEASQVWLIWTP